MKLTTLEGGAQEQLAASVPYPKLTYLKRGEQQESWDNSLRSAEEQTHKFYLTAVAYPESETAQEKYRESLQAMENLRTAYDLWKQKRI